MRTMDARLYQKPNWKSFESRVKSALESLGYKTQSDRLIAGTQIDLYAELKGDLFVNRFVVECKSSASPIGVQEVRQLSALAEAISLKKRPIFGLIIAETGFTKTATQFAEQAGVRLMTLTDLLALTFDPEPIARHTVHWFESGDLESTYVDLSCQVREETGGTIYKPVERFLDDFLAKTHRPGAAVLGNFGTGKTSLCRHYAYLLAKRWLSGDTKLLPIYVSLREIRDLTHLETDILRILVDEYEASVTPVGLRQWLTAGSTLLFLDGFDEMASKLDRVSINESLVSVSRFSERHRTKVILTCRTHFFKTELEESALKGMLRLYMCDWGALELKEYVHKSLPKTAESSLRRIRETYDLEGLSRTPIFLNMITATIGELTGSVNQAKLYQLYTDRWIQSQDYRSKLSPDQKQKFMEDLAYEMYVRSMPRIAYEQLPIRLGDLFGIKDHDALHKFDEDIRTCTFLVRDEHGIYYFSHKSFMEFFVALRLAKSVKGNQLSDFERCELSREIASFFANYFENDWVMLVRVLLSNHSSIARANCASVLAFLPAKKPIIDSLGLALETDNSISVRQRVVDALAGIGGEEAVIILLKHSKGDGDLAIYCLRSLRSFLSDASVASLHREILLGEEKSALRVTAVLSNITEQAAIEFRSEVCQFLNTDWWRGSAEIESSSLGVIQALADLEFALNVAQIIRGLADRGSENRTYAAQIQAELRVRFKGRVQDLAVVNKRDGLPYARNAALVRERFGYLVDDSVLGELLKDLYPLTRGKKKRSSRGRKG